MKECPSRTIIFETELTASNFNELKPYMVCVDEVSMDTMTYNEARQYITDEKCASYVLKSQPGEIVSNLTFGRIMY